MRYATGRAFRPYCRRLGRPRCHGDDRVSAHPDMRITRITRSCHWNAYLPPCCAFHLAQRLGEGHRIGGPGERADGSVDNGQLRRHVSAFDIGDDGDVQVAERVEDGIVLC
jgi:hypothetical protein